MKLEVESGHTINYILDRIKSCEGKHIQQVVFSTYHKALTQICFGCGKVRTMLAKKELEEEE